MIDTDKYEGHTEGEWIAEGNDKWGWAVETPKHDDPYAFIERRNDDGQVVSLSKADAQLIADAPLLLAEIKRLRMIVARLEDARIESASMYDRPKLFHAVREIYEQRLQDIYQEKREEE